MAKASSLVLGTLAATRLEAQIPNKAPAEGCDEDRDELQFDAPKGAKEAHAQQHPANAPDNKAQFRAMDQVARLQDVGLVQLLHGGATPGEDMNMTFVDAGEQQIVHGLLCRLQIGTYHVQSAPHGNLLSFKNVGQNG